MTVSPPPVFGRSPVVGVHVVDMDEDADRARVGYQLAVLAAGALAARHHHAVALRQFGVHDLFLFVLARVHRGLGEAKAWVSCLIAALASAYSRAGQRLGASAVSLNSFSRLLSM